MRKDMAKVVTEARARGTRIQARSGAAVSIRTSTAPRITAQAARRRRVTGRYGWNAKEFSDVLGPLRRYLRKQAGRPWDKVWSEITQTLDRRSLTGQHIFDHIRWEVEQHAWIGEDNRLYHQRRREHRADKWTLRQSRHTASLLQTGAAIRIPRQAIRSCASSSAGLWPSSFYS